MPDNYQKLWIQDNLNQLGKTRALEQIQNTGAALPCKVVAVLGAIVQVAFQPLVSSPQTLPNIWIPVAESQWLRIPVQEGDLGVTIPADTFLGGVSGLGSGLADTTVNYGNLTTLVFMPVGNTNFPEMPSSSRAWVNGPTGFDATDTAQTGGIRYDATTGTVTIFAGDQTIVLTSDPSLTTTITGTLGSIQTIVDGANNAISLIVPTVAGPPPQKGILGLGALFSALDSTRAAAANSDLDSLVNGPNGFLQQTFVKLASAIGAAAISNPSFATFGAALEAAGFIPGISGLAPVIPDCSSIVRLAE